MLTLLKENLETQEQNKKEINDMFNNLREEKIKIEGIYKNILNINIDNNKKFEDQKQKYKKLELKINKIKEKTKNKKDKKNKKKFFKKYSTNDNNNVHTIVNSSILEEKRNTHIIIDDLPLIESIHTIIDNDLSKIDKDYHLTINNKFEGEYILTEDDLLTNNINNINSNIISFVKKR